MAPYSSIPLSPAELAYLHTSLAQSPPIRPDGRAPTQFRPMVAETDILPSANGSARICFADGTEAIVGVKTEVEKSRRTGVQSEVRGGTQEELGTAMEGDVDMDDVQEDGERARKGKGEEGWVEISIEIPGMRDDDALPTFLAAMLTEALMADEQLKDRLWINSRFHWRVYVDVCARSTHLEAVYKLMRNIDSASFPATLLPATFTLIDDTFGSLVNAPTGTHLREGRRSALQ